MKTILLIDKDAVNQNHIPGVLKEFGYKVLFTESGRKGIKMVKDYHPDLILCDLELSEIDGYSVLAELNKNQDTAAIPFIFTSAEKTSISDIRYAMDQGADDYLLKPFNVSELLKALNARITKYERITKKDESRAKKAQAKTTAKRRLTEEDHILLSVGSRPELVKVSSIAYITAVEEYSNVYLTQKKSLLVQRLLKEWERILPEKAFVRIHRSTIVNLNHVNKMEKWFNHSFRLYLNDIPQAFVISRRYSTKIRALLSYSKV